VSISRKKSDVSTDLAEEVQNAIGPDLRLRGFVMVEAPVVSKEFGDELLIFDSTSLRVRVVRERDRVSVDIASQYRADQWWDFDLVEEVLRLKDATLTMERQTSQIQRLGRVLREQYGAIERAFAEKHLSETVEALDRAGELRARRFLPTGDEDGSVN
jgi:hypothetical protein